MFLSEPPVTQFDLHFQIAGIPVRVHPLFWLGGVITGGSLGDLLYIGIWIAIVFVSILIHELGHAFVMRRFGESPRVVLHLMGGLAIADGGGYPWGSSAQSRQRHPVEQILISAAGPGAGFLLAILVVVAIQAAGGRVHLQSPDIRSPVFWDVEGVQHLLLSFVVNQLLFVNITWGLVNLLPVNPLDGGQIARELMTQRDPWDGVRKSLLLSVIVGGAMAAVGLMYWNSIFVAMLFGSLAVSNYLAWQQIGGGGGRRPW